MKGFFAQAVTGDTGVNGLNGGLRRLLHSSKDELSLVTGWFCFSCKSVQQNILVFKKTQGQCAFSSYCGR